MRRSGIEEIVLYDDTYSKRGEKELKREEEKGIHGMEEAATALIYIRILFQFGQTGQWLRDWS